jgi:ABC-type uncharacterized transport system auxiliary subunit
MMRVVAVAVLLILTGCSGLFHSNAPPEQVYYLQAHAPTPEGARPAQPGHLTSVRVGRPVPGPGLESSHIVLLESDRRMSFYKASRWPAALPDVVEELTTQVLRASGAWSDVQSSDSVFPSDYLLQIRIRRFDADYSSGAAERSGSAPEAHVVLDCTLGRRDGREVIATFAVEGTAAASANRLSNVVAAFEEATNVALSSLAAHAVDAAKASDQKVDKPVTSITR